MKFTLLTSALAATSFTSTVLAQAGASSTNSSICDYYTKALLTNNTADNQYTLLTLLVNTVVIGNYTKSNSTVKVPGILANTMYNGTAVNLLPYFDGGLASTNRSGKAVAVNFLDDGGAVPLMMNKPANGTSSNQYFLMTHLYQFFGSLLGCSQQGMPGFSIYQGGKSMYAVHGFMDLNPYQVGYFISQVGAAAEFFGVATSDIQTVATALTTLFDYKCSPPTTVIKSQGPALQAICIDASCPTSPMNSTCAAYAAAVMPGVSNSTLAMGEGNTTNTATSVYTVAPTAAASAASAAGPAGTATAGSGSASASATGSGSTAVSTGGASHHYTGGLFAGGVVGLAAFLL